MHPLSKNTTENKLQIGDGHTKTGHSTVQLDYSHFLLAETLPTERNQQEKHRRQQISLSSDADWVPKPPRVGWGGVGWDGMGWEGGWPLCASCSSSATGTSPDRKSLGTGHLFLNITLRRSCSAMNCFRYPEESGITQTFSRIQFFFKLCWYKFYLLTYVWWTFLFLKWSKPC